jgi:hypothetical protein
MPETNDSLDPSHGSFRWAWRRGQAHLVGFFVGVVMLGVLAIAIANLITVPSNATVKERIAYGILAFLVSVLLASIVAFSWALIRAPYEQRDMLHRDSRRLQGSIDEQYARRKRLLEDRVLTNETFYVWELLVPGDRPIVRDRVFTDCVVKGPAIVTLMLDTEFTHTQLGSLPVESLLYESIEGPHQGLIALVNCRFVRGRLERIGYYGDRETLDKLRKVAVI